MHSKNSRKRQDERMDALLIARIQRRESDWRDLFGDLVRDHQGAVYARCLAYLRNPADAADAMQETLFRAFRAIDGFKGDAAFRTWLFAIADNQCHTLARRRARYLLDGHNPTPVCAEPMAPPAVEDELDSCQETVHAALGQIAAKGRDVLHLRYFADLSIDEIAATLGVGISAAKMRLYRAQGQLASLLREYTMDRAA